MKTVQTAKVGGSSMQEARKMITRAVAAEIKADVARKRVRAAKAKFKAARKAYKQAKKAARHAREAATQLFERKTSKPAKPKRPGKRKPSGRSALKVDETKPIPAVVSTPAEEAGERPESI